MPINVDNIVYTEFDPQIANRFQARAAIQAFGTPVSMRSDERTVPIDLGIDVKAYNKTSGRTKDTTGFADVSMKATRFYAQASIDEDDLSDTDVRVIESKALNIVNDAALKLNRACFATSGAAVQATNVPFVSLYRRLWTADSDQGYAAKANAVERAANEAVGKDQLLEAIQLVADGNYFDETQMVWIGDTSFITDLNSLAGATGQTISVDPEAPLLRELLGYPLAYFPGLKVTANMDTAGTGASLLFFVNRQHLINGNRDPFDFFITPSDAQSQFRETAFVGEVRKGFVQTLPAAASVIAKTRS